MPANKVRDEKADRPPPTFTNTFFNLGGLSLDFISGLPLSNGFTTILVVVDWFSKGAYFGALPSHYTTHKIVILFFDIIGKLHGFPQSLIPDRDPLFISSFWRELFRLSDTKLRMSSSYHPQMDEQTKVLNCILEQYLRAFVHDKPTHWHKFLALAEWSYNSSIHSTTNLSPFEVMFGKLPPSIPNYLLRSSSIEAMDTILATQTALHNTLQRRLAKAQVVMKLQADLLRRDVQFFVGDWVFVHIRLFRQTSLSPTYSKLSKHIYGPFQIEEHIG